MAILDGRLGLINTSWAALKIGLYAKHMDNWMKVCVSHNHTLSLSLSLSLSLYLNLVNTSWAALKIGLYAKHMDNWMKVYDMSTSLC